MCTETAVNNRIVRDLAQVRELGWKVEPHQDHPADWTDDLCLCGVDVEAILTRTGLDYTSNDFGYVVAGGP